MIQWVNDHFAKWGEWVQLGHGRGSAGMAVCWDSVGRSGFAQAIVPIKDIALSRTHDWVLSLPEPDQLLLYRVYCTPKTARENAAIVGCSLRTLYAHLHRVQTAYAKSRDEVKKTG